MWFIDLFFSQFNLNFETLKIDFFPFEAKVDNLFAMNHFNMVHPFLFSFEEGLFW